MKISLIESYQVQDVRHYELDETKIEADFGSTEDFEEALLNSEWSEDTHFLNLLHEYGKEVNFKQNQQQWSDFTIQQGHIKQMVRVIKLKKMELLKNCKKLTLPKLPKNT